MSDKYVVLIGFVGSGMTTLFNKICDTKQKSQFGGSFATSTAYCKQSAYGKGFILFDTPGFGVKSKNFNRACTVRKVLTQRPVNRLLIVARFGRTDMFGYLPIEGYFDTNRHQITVIITHWDLALKQDQQYQQQIQLQIKQRLEQINVCSCLFVSNNTTGQELCQQIDEMLETNKQSYKILISNTQFLFSNDFLELSDYLEEELYTLAESFTMKFRRQSKVFKDYIQKANLELLHSITTQIKDHAKKMMKEFIDQNFELFSKLEENVGNNAFLIYYEFKKKISIDVIDVIETCQRKMRTYPEHCYNFIKQCPNCGEIWIKETLCSEKITVCGYLPHIDEQQRQESQNNKQSINTKRNQNTCLISQFGCRKQFNWEETPPLKQNLIRELIIPNMYDFLAMEVNQLEEKQRTIFFWSIEEEMRKITIQQL